MSWSDPTSLLRPLMVAALACDTCAHNTGSRALKRGAYTACAVLTRQPGHRGVTDYLDHRRGLVWDSETCSWVPGELASACSAWEAR